MAAAGIASGARRDVSGKGVARALAGAAVAFALAFSGPSVLAQALPPPAQPRATPPVPVPTAPAGPPAEVVVPAAEGRVPPGAERVRAVLRDLVLEGATVYPAEALRPFYEGLIGKEISLAQLFDVATRIQEQYRADGYLLTRVIVPAQTVTDGVFRLRVVEGYVSAVRLEGDVGPVAERLQRYLDRITSVRPVRKQDVERYLLLATDVPGVTAFGVLRPGAGEAGAAELLVQVERKPFEGYVLGDNRGSKYKGPVRVAASVQENSATALGEKVRLLVLSTVGNAEERYGEIDYEQPLGDDGLRVRAALASDWTNPGWKLEPYDIETQSTRAEAEVSYPLVRSRAWNLYLAGGVRAIDTWEDALGDPFVRDHLRVVYAGLATDFDDPLGGRSAASVGLRQGLRGLGASQPGDADLSRADGVPDATILALDASRVQVFGETDIGLYLAASGQYASNPLLVDQQFCVGGERFGRGYDPCDLAGDDGVGFTAEIQYTRSVDSTVLRGYQAYGFYDLGVVWNRDSEASDLPAKASLASAGAGVRTQLREQVYLDLEVAKPLTRVPASHNDKDPLVFLTLSVRF